MAEPTPPSPAAAPSAELDPGAPIARDAIDPELIKLARHRPRVGIITAAGLVFLAVLFLIRLDPDRRFAGSRAQPATATVADVLAGKVATEQLVSVAAEPLVSSAIRVTPARGTSGLRLAPARGTADRLWLVASGDGRDRLQPADHVGRLRKLDDLAIAAAAHDYADQHPRPVFASAAAVRSGFASGRVATVAGDAIAIADGDAIALDIVDPGAATIAAAFNERLPDVAAWRAALDGAGLTPTATGTPDAALGQVRFTVAASVSATTARLETARLWAARVEPIPRHFQTTWAALRRSPPAGLDVGGTILPDDQIDLVGLYVARGIPAGAYALVAGESPDDYWYVMPITVALAAIVIVFAWALIRAIRRDLLPARTA
ncbi:MAG TPA: hypothetical protein VHT91_24295 [Kofleriaceae bacterium]|nr:hypothetical protein [Kofleriaceae bacterium]